MANNIWSKIVPTKLNKLNLMSPVTVRLLGDPVEVFYVWDDGSTPNAATVTTPAGSPFAIASLKKNGPTQVDKDYNGPGKKYSRYCWSVIDRADGNIKVVELPKTALMQAVQVGASVNLKPHELGGSDGLEININRSGTGINTRYNVTGKLSTLTDTEIKDIESSLPDLEIHYDLKPIAVEGDYSIKAFTLPCECGAKEGCPECGGTGTVYIKDNIVKKAFDWQ